MKAILEYHKKADAGVQKWIEFKNLKCMKASLNLTKTTIDMFMKLNSKEVRSFIHICLWKEGSPPRGEAKKIPSQKGSIDKENAAIRKLVYVGYDM